MIDPIDVPDSVWQRVEYGDYRADLPYWLAMALKTDGLVCDIGAGAGRVTLPLLAAGVPMIAVDYDSELLSALCLAAGWRSVMAVRQDARELALPDLAALMIVPCSTIHMLGGHDDRMRFFRAAYRNLTAKGTLVVALHHGLTVSNDEPQPPDVLELAGCRYVSRPMGWQITDEHMIWLSDRSVGDGPAHRHFDVLWRLTATECAAEARLAGFTYTRYSREPDDGRGFPHALLEFTC